MAKPLPQRPDPEQLKKQAKELHRLLQTGDAAAVRRFEQHQGPGGGKPSTRRSLAGAQRILAREHGFTSWPALVAHIEAIRRVGADPLTALHRSFAEDDAPWLRSLLKMYPEFKARINEPAGPFGAVAITQVRSRAMLDVLLENGADINAKSHGWAGGFGLLHSADPGLSEYAIQRGAVVDIHAAARLGHIDRLRELLAKNPALVHARGGDGQTPLHFAANTDVAELLLESGADIDARDIDHESTPAQYMIADRPDVARHLVARGCATDLLLVAALGDMERVRRHLDLDPTCIRVRVNAEFFPMREPRAGGTIYQWTLGRDVSAHDVARERGHGDVFRILMERSPAGVQLLAACYAGDESLVQAIRARHPHVLKELAATESCHPAHAARNNRRSALRLMLGAGLPVDASGQHGGAALHWAAFHGNATMVADILAFQPLLELRDRDFKSTPLGWAIHGSENGWHVRTGNYPAVVRLLLEAGATLAESMIGGSEEVRSTLLACRGSASACEPG